MRQRQRQDIDHNNIKATANAPNHEMASEGEELDFDLSKLAKRLSISSEDWQSDRESPGLSRSLKQEQSHGSTGLADGLPERGRDKSDTPETFTFESKPTTPRAPERSSNASSQVAGPGLSGGDASWFQALTQPTFEKKEHFGIDSLPKRSARKAPVISKHA